MNVTPAALLSSLGTYPELAGQRRYVVAFSGGLDSTVLLDLARRALPSVPGAALAAVHIDHGWHAQSATWVEHCAAVAARFGVRFDHRRVDTGAARGESPEAAARAARYEALAARLEPGDVLLSAHHADDQLETVLLQALRGAGVAGLAGMPVLTRFSRGWHWRPLLDVPRAALAGYAREWGLEWLEDPANRDPRYDRSFLRAEIAPRLVSRWPSAARAVVRSARHCATAAGLLDELAQMDLADACDEAGRVRVGALEPLSAPRQANLLRYWIHSRGLPPPGSAHLQRCREDLLYSRHDAEPCVRWPGAELRRYRDRLYALAPLPPEAGAYSGRLDATQNLELPAGLGTLALVPAGDGGIGAEHCERGFDVTFRHGGERIRPADSAHTRELRTLYQERGIVPWMRPRIPLIHLDGALVAVGDLWVAGAFAPAAGEPGRRIEWREHPPLY